MADLLRGLCLALVLLSASGSAAAQSAGERVDAGDVQLTGLPAQDLETGHCGLFLWSKSPRPVFIVFATDTPAKAKISLNGKMRQLKRTLVSGEPVFGHFEKQTFSGNGVTFQLDLTFDREKPVQDGAVIKTGVLRTRSKRGFEAVVPVGGMIGCRKAD
jgi:hypothetical protein